MSLTTKSFKMEGHPWKGMYAQQGRRRPPGYRLSAACVLLVVMALSSVIWTFQNGSPALPIVPFASAAEEENSPGVTLKQTGPVSRRLESVVKKAIKYAVTWQPVEREMPSINMDRTIFIAGRHMGDRPAAFEVSLEDVLILFFRWFTSKNTTVWPSQGLVAMEALKREHTRYGSQMVKEFTRKQEEPEEDEEKKKQKLLPIHVYSQIGACNRRIRDWFFDGNTYHRRGAEAFRISETLTEKDVSFMRGLPFSTLRIARGVFSERVPEEIQHIERELAVRGVKTIDQLLSRTNFIDMFVLFDIFDEMYSQIDILSEYKSNWQKYRSDRYKPPQIPLGEWKEKQTIQEMILDENYPDASFPKCTTVKCMMRWTWTKTPERTIEVTKKDTNALKLLIVGSTGVTNDYADAEQRNRTLHKYKQIAGVTELETTVKAMKSWHEREKADGVLGLGDLIGMPGPTTVRDERFDTKWYDVFVKDGGLDVPWLMTVGDTEAVLNPSSLVRYHYSNQHKNWHMPNDYYTVTYKFGSNLTLANGMYEETTFNATILNINTWDLLLGNPVANNMQSWTTKLAWLSEQLYQATQRNSTWLIVTGHHPLLSTGPEAEQARLQYVDDVYRNRRPAGLETFMINVLFLHYQVDAYVSAHDYFMDFNSITDEDRNVTVNFITSGAASRLLHKDIGRGWIGRLRGSLYPVFCWMGRKILFAVNPGGCRPQQRELDAPDRFFVQSQGGKFKVTIEERVTKATGFAAMKLTRDYMIVDFVDAARNKSAVHKVHRRTNRDGRDIKFLDPWAEAALRYEELLVERQAFEWENADKIEKEILFSRRCPTVAARVQFFRTEMNELVDQYNDLAQQKDSFEVMDDASREAMQAQGTNVPQKIHQLMSEMYVIAADHLKLEKRYKEALELKENMPETEDPRYKQLFELERQYVTTRKERRKLTAMFQSDGYFPDAKDEENLEKAILEMKLLRKAMDDLEAEMKKYPDPEQKKKADEAKKQRQKEKGKPAPKPVDYKPLDTSLLARIQRKEVLLRKHHAVLRRLKKYPQEELKNMRAEIDILKKQEKAIKAELFRLRQLNERAHKPMRPADVWDKFQIKDELETKLRQMQAYLAEVARMPVAERHSPELQEELDTLETQRASTEAELTEIVDELAERHPTELQQKFLQLNSELHRTELVLEQRRKLSPEELALPQVAAALKAAAERNEVLQAEVEKLHEQVRVELNEMEDKWEQEMLAKGYRIEGDVIIGPEVEQLSPEEQSSVAGTGDIEKATKAMQELDEAKSTVARLDEMLKNAEGATPEQLKEMEELAGPLDELTKQREEAQQKVDQLQKVVDQDVHRIEEKLSEEKDETDQTGDKETDTAGSTSSGENPETGDAASAPTEGSTSRRLAEIMELFKEKREPSPYKKLEKIDLGPVDSCMQMPMLDAAVSRVLNPVSDEETKEKCVYQLATSAYRQQLRFIHRGLFFSRSPQGITPSTYEQPSVHVARTWSRYFGYTHPTRFKSTMLDLRSKLRQVHKDFKLFSFKGAMKMEEQEAARRREEESLVAGDQDIEVREQDIDMDKPKLTDEEAKLRDEIEKLMAQARREKEKAKQKGEEEARQRELEDEEEDGLEGQDIPVDELDELDN
ncbi:acid phosphatase [Cystoisospora suis]|uniref:Acid phosphatase n=1 Tax=Cystoisospora suis TaxID=483139 RepID=A0A2C6KKU0_9APIC|nr:acid phosphatase [Cystoisospora suis]